MKEDRVGCYTVEDSTAARKLQSLLLGKAVADRHLAFSAAVPAQVQKGSVPVHIDRHVFEPTLPAAVGWTAVVYLTGGGKLMFHPGGKEVQAKAGRLVMWESDQLHSFEADDEDSVRAMLGPVAVYGGKLSHALMSSSDLNNLNNTIQGIVMGCSCCLGFSLLIPGIVLVSMYGAPVLGTVLLVLGVATSATLASSFCNLTKKELPCFVKLFCVAIGLSLLIAGFVSCVNAGIETGEAIGGIVLLVLALLMLGPLCMIMFSCIMQPLLDVVEKKMRERNEERERERERERELMKERERLARECELERLDRERAEERKQLGEEAPEAGAATGAIIGVA